MTSSEMRCAAARCWPAALLVLGSGCSFPAELVLDAGSGSDAAELAEPVLLLVDISDRSPDLGAAPYGGQAGWDHSDKYAPGVALIDLDGDGVLDLVQPRNDRSDPDLRALRMYRGAGDGTFADVTPVAWDSARNATVVLAFDYDGDDDLDVFVGVDGGPSALYRNEGNWSFTEVAVAAGVAAAGVRVFAAAAADYDGDGDLDLYLGVWNASAPEHGPGSAPNLLFRNDGDGTFTDVTAAAGVSCDGRSTLGLAWADFDDDGDQDLYVANDYFDACLYENRGDGTFVDIAEAAGVLHGAWHGMGVAVGDLDGDGDLDLMVTDDEWPDDSRGNAVYLNRGGAPISFASRGQALGLDGIATLQADWLVSWGVGLIDLDFDGDLDVHVATHGERSELVWQQVDGSFIPQYDLMNSLADVDARGTAYGDIDGDGDLDLVIARRGAGLQVIRNDTVAGAWLTVAPRPLGTAPGTRVTITAGGRTQVAEIAAGSSYMSSQQPIAVFGLGAATIVDSVIVERSDGTRREHTNVTPGTALQTW